MNNTNIYITINLLKYRYVEIDKKIAYFINSATPLFYSHI